MMQTMKRAGRVALAIVGVIAATAFVAPGAGAAQTGASSPPVEMLRSTVLSALGQTSAGNAVQTVGNSLAFLGARYKLEETEQRLAKEEAAAPPEPEPELEEVKDPSEMAPASAGSNGTTIPHSDSLAAAKIVAHSRPGENGTSNAILLNGVALAPPDAPEAVKNVINAANTIVGRPYIWGGGHASFYSYGYDCSGSVSFALFGGGLIPEPLTSGSLEGWGAPGPGKWITVYANGGHTFAEIAGLRWDTVGDARGTGPRWHLSPASGAGFVVRHPPGY
jgi:cell wall-associated NlpC family hydrolase